MQNAITLNSEIQLKGVRDFQTQMAGFASRLQEGFSSATLPNDLQAIVQACQADPVFRQRITNEAAVILQRPGSLQSPFPG